MKLSFSFLNLFWGLLLLLGACGVMPADDDRLQAEGRRINDKNRQRYEAVAGVYQGELFTPGSIARKITVQLYLSETQKREDDKGNPLPTVILLGKVSFDSVGILDDHLFTNVVYDSHTGDITLKDAQANGGGTDRPGMPPMSAPGCSVGPADGKLSITQARIRSGEFVGELQGGQGPIGRLQLRIQKDGTLFPLRTDKERLTSAYEKIEGIYGGLFSNTLGDGRDQDNNFPVQLILLAAESGDGRYDDCPVLKGQYSRPDYSPGVGVIALRGDVVSGDSMLSIKSVLGGGAGDRVPGSRDLSITGRWQESGKITGRMDWLGRNGQVALVRCPKSGKVGRDGGCRGGAQVPPPSREKMQWVYGGRFVSADRRGQSFPVRLTLTRSGDSGQREPGDVAIEARYERPDFSSGAGTIELLGLLNEEKKTFVLKSKNPQGGGVPGSKDLQINGQIVLESSVEAKMLLGTQKGTLKLNYCSSGNVTGAGKCRP